MLSEKDFDGKVLVEYYRDKKGNPRGVVVSIGPGVVGWSLCSKLDVFTKDQAKNIAFHRAIKAGTLNPDETGFDKHFISKRDEFYLGVPDTLIEKFNKIYERSYLYFKHKE